MTETILHIIDIDGCIMPSIFPTGFPTNLTDKLLAIGESYKKAAEIQLYPSFVKYYNKKRADVYTIPLFIFITGRQKAIYEWLTTTQLEILGGRLLKNLLDNKCFFIKYFPNKIWHTAAKYRFFKVRRTVELANNRLFQKKIVYDDDDSYFGAVKRSLNKDVDITFYKMSCNADWEKLYNSESCLLHY